MDTEKSREAGFDDVENPPPTYTERSNVSESQENPPGYNTASQSAPPPSYESLYGRVIQAKAQSTGNLSFMKTFISILFGTIGFTILIGLFMAIPVSMIVMGALYLDDCDVERMIPIYLIVAGTFGCAKSLFSFISRCCKSQEEREESTTKVHPLVSIVDCFLFIWFIVGCVYIYRTKGEFQSDDKDLPDYCDYTFYWYSFWITTSVYIMMGCSCLCICCIGCLVACFK